MEHDANRILVVDDQEDTRAAIAKFFTAQGFEVCVANGGVEAISHVINQKMDVVILKAQLPGLTGYDTALIIRKLAPEVRVILTLDESDMDKERKTKQVDSFEFFLEPLNLEEIRQAVNES